MDKLQELKKKIEEAQNNLSKREARDAVFQAVSEFLKSIDINGIFSRQLTEAEGRMSEKLGRQILSELRNIEKTLKEELRKDSDSKIVNLDKALRAELQKLAKGTSTRKDQTKLYKLLMGEITGLRGSIPKPFTPKPDLLIETINQDTDKKIKKERIEGWKELEQKAGRQGGGGAIAGRDLFKDIDLSDQLDGSTKTFQIQAIWNIVSVDLSSFPYALRKGVDYTYTPTSITFTDEINAATSLAEGQTCVLTVVTA